VERREVRGPAPLRGARAGSPWPASRSSSRRCTNEGGHPAQGHPRGARRVIVVRRRANVIPQVVSPAPARGREARPPASGASAPLACPFCATKTIKPQDSVFTKCPNPCLARGRALAAAQALRSRAGRWTSRGLGEEAGRAAAGSANPRRDRPPTFLSPARRLSCSSWRGSASCRPRETCSGGDRGLQAAPLRHASLFALGIEEVGEVTGRKPRAALP